MTVILYTETNFILGIATGRDTQSDFLLNNWPEQVALFMPSICYLEIIIALENEKKRQKLFLQSLTIEINEAKRKVNLPFASDVVHNLDQSSLFYELMFNKFQSKFIDTVSLLETKVNWIIPQSGEIKATLTNPLLKKDREIRDNLILQSILNHAAKNQDLEKLFFTANTPQFNTSEVKAEFNRLNINYFSNSENLISNLANFR